MKKPFFALWILTLALFVFSWVYLPGISKYRDLKIKQEQIETEIKVLDEKLKAVREERDLLKNDVQYLEKVIRDELGLVKPGEVVYKFVPEAPPEPPKKEEAPAPVPEVSKAPASKTQVSQMPAISIQALNDAAEGQLATPVVTPESDDPIDVNAHELTDTDEPVYPRKEIR